MSRTLLAGVVALALALVWVAQPARAAGVTYYVSATGSDSNNGLSTSSAFATIQRAANLTNPGDTVYILDGTYTPVDNEGVVTITRSGTAAAYIIYAAYPGHQPRLYVPKTANAWNAVLIAGASYIKVEGLTIQGDNDNITYTEAYNNRSGSSPTYNTNCILVRQNNTTNARPHHIEIRGNTVSKCPGGGIATEYVDYITIEDNVVHSNAWYAVYANSGISLFHSWNFDTTTGVKNIIRRNVSYNNEGFIPWVNTGSISDGNGIIVDDNKHTQDRGEAAYTGRTLVENNLVFNNGGSGIHAYASAHVDIINNTAYLNSRSPALDYGSIFANDSDDVFILNNISYVRSGERSNENFSNQNVTYDYNLYYNGLAPVVLGPNDRVADPVFVNPSTDPATANFRLAANSPAIDSGTSQKAPGADFAGTARPQNSAYDRGAYEFVGTPSPTATPAPTPAPSTVLHVASITMDWQRAGKNRQGIATVKVVDANGAPVANASVTGSWTGACTSTWNSSTGTDGTTKAYSCRAPATTTVTFCVTSITRSGWSYDPSANVVSCGTITLPQ